MPSPLYWMDLKSKVWIVIAAFNEASVIQETLNELKNLPYSVVVVDDHSSDGTYEKAKASGVDVCRHAVNLGQGAALQTGIGFALQKGAEVIVTFDADGQHCPADISRLIAPILQGRAQVALGSRFLEGARAINIKPRKKWLLKLGVAFTRFSTGMELTDTHNGFRAFHRKAAQAIRIRQNRMSHASEILTEIRRHHLTYKEIPVTIRYTDYSLQKGQKISNSFNILWDLCFSGASQ